ncbi:hypothetical protein ACQB60_35990 [Actinomycetota bacterium Odt1-20B]
MFRHVSAPARFFSQVPNEIIRHPRLSSDAVRLLTWQLSLPAEAEESLSRTARRAGIGKVAFLRAKGQLKDEGYVHEWREQVERGRWRTRQLVSKVPLVREEAIRLAGGGADESMQVAPTGGAPAAGAPVGRSVGRLPEETPVGNTLQPGAEVDAVLAEGRRVVDALPQLDPRLRVPRGMFAELSVLAAEWLVRGHTAEGVWREVSRQLPCPGTGIHRPGGLLRYVLRRIPPVAVPPAPRPEPRVARMRECAGERHVQVWLFRPVGDEELCAECRRERAAESEPEPVPSVESAAVRGASVVRAALRGAGYGVSDPPTCAPAGVPSAARP